jgi:hypothetical protein
MEWPLATSGATKGHQRPSDESGGGMSRQRGADVAASSRPDDDGIESRPANGDPPVLRAPNGPAQDSFEYRNVGKAYYDPAKITVPTAPWSGMGQRNSSLYAASAAPAGVERVRQTERQWPARFLAQSAQKVYRLRCAEGRRDIWPRAMVLRPA